MTRVVVALTAAISTADIQVAFVAWDWAKAKPIHFMSGLRLRHREERRLAAWIGNVGIRRDSKLRDLVYTRLVSNWRRGVGDIESAVDGIVRIERHSEQPWLVPGEEFGGDIEKRYRIHRSGGEFDDLDLTCVFHHEKPARIPGRSSYAERLVESARDQYRLEGVAGARR